MANVNFHSRWHGWNEERQGLSSDQQTDRRIRPIDEWLSRAKFEKLKFWFFFFIFERHLYIIMVDNFLTVTKHLFVSPTWPVKPVIFFWGGEGGWGGRLVQFYIASFNILVNLSIPTHFTRKKLDRIAKNWNREIHLLIIDAMSGRYDPWLVQ